MFFSSAKSDFLLLRILIEVEFLTKMFILAIKVPLVKMRKFRLETPIQIAQLRIRKHVNEGFFLFSVDLETISPPLRLLLINFIFRFREISTCSKC
jgi:hypothetical protein